MATLQSITKLLKDIDANIALVIQREQQLKEENLKLKKENQEFKTMIRSISIKKYIEECKESIKVCYDMIDKKLQRILGITSEKQEGQTTIFQKGYLLYELIRTSDITQFIELLKNKDIIYNTVVVINEPQTQTGGAKSTLLQVIGLSKIKAIIEYMNIANESNLDISAVDNANALSNREDIIDAIAEFFYKQPIMLLQSSQN
jgi:hypothetical protein